MLNGIIVDGIEYPMIVSVTRTAKVTPSEVSGMMLSKHYNNDVIATYFEYEVKMAVPAGREEDYTRLYEVLTAPVSEHQFVMPYNQSTLVLTARVETVQDEYYRTEGSSNAPTRIWKGISFTIIATRPSKE
jgi:hypothetical protein